MKDIFASEANGIKSIEKDKNFLRDKNTLNKKYPGELSKLIFSTSECSETYLKELHKLYAKYDKSITYDIFLKELNVI